MPGKDDATRLNSCTHISHDTDVTPATRRTELIIIIIIIILSDAHSE